MRKFYFSIVIVLFVSVKLFSQAGLLDAAFGSAGIVNTSFGIQYADEINDMAIQSDGKIVVVGVTNDPISELDKISLARYNANGSLDLAFGTGGLVTTSVIANFHCRGIAVDIQPDGKIIVGGEANDTATIAPQNGYYLVLRFNSNGTLDNTFNSTGIKSVQSASNYSTEVYITDVLLQPDGNIVLSAGVYYSVMSEFVFMRLTPNGALDNTFGTAGLSVISSTIGEALPAAIALQSDGKIVYSGFIDGSTTNYPMVGRLNADGSADAGFGSSGHVLPSFSASAGFLGITIDAAGNIIACGFENGALLQRFQPNGSVDLSFGTNGYLITPIGSQQDAVLNDVKVQNDGKIVAAGAADAAFALMRATSVGSLDLTFGSSGVTQTSITPGVYAEANAIQIQGDGKILLAGTNITANPSAISVYALARYTNDVTTSLVDRSKNESDLFFPNPADKRLSFQLPSLKENTSIEIYNLSGQLVMKEEINHSHSELNISELCAGIYTVTIKDRVKTSHHKLVIAH